MYMYMYIYKTIREYWRIANLYGLRMALGQGIIESLSRHDVAHWLQWCGNGGEGNSLSHSCTCMYSINIVQSSSLHHSSLRSPSLPLLHPLLPTLPLSFPLVLPLDLFREYINPSLGTARKTSIPSEELAPLTRDWTLKIEVYVHVHVHAHCMYTSHKFVNLTKCT